MPRYDPLLVLVGVGVGGGDGEVEGACMGYWDGDQRAYQYPVEVGDQEPQTGFTETQPG